MPNSSRSSSSPGSNVGTCLYMWDDQTQKWTLHENHCVFPAQPHAPANDGAAQGMISQGTCRVEVARPASGGGAGSSGSGS